MPSLEDAFFSSIPCLENLVFSLFQLSVLRDYIHTVSSAVGIHPEVNEELIKEVRVTCGCCFWWSENDKHTGSGGWCFQFGQFSYINWQKHVKSVPHSSLTLWLHTCLFSWFRSCSLTLSTHMPSSLQQLHQVYSSVGCGTKSGRLWLEGDSTLVVIELHPTGTFIKMHKSSQGDKSLSTYKTINPFSPEKRLILFVSDIYHISPRPPGIVGHIHLLTKTPESYG